MSSLQINLLPEARIVKLKAQQRKRTMTTVTTIVCIVVATIIITFVLLLGYTYSVHATNKARIESLNKDVSKTKDMEQDAATLQEHLNSFYNLNKSRLYVSEIFRNLSNVIPADVTVSSFQISQDYLVTISGKASSFAQVGVFATALQQYNVNYKPQPNLERKALFTNVNITSVTKESETGSGSVSYGMTFKVDPSVFKKN